MGSRSNAGEAHADVEEVTGVDLEGADEVSGEVLDIWKILGWFFSEEVKGIFQVSVNVVVGFKDEG